MEYPEDEYLMISGIQHFAFCRRQWALIHIEQVWQENLRTAEGRILHENAMMHVRRKNEAACSSVEVCAYFPVRWACRASVMWLNSMRRRRGQSSISIRDSGSRILLSTNMVRESLWMLTGSSFVRRPCASKRCIVQMCPKVHCSMLHRIGGRK